MENIQIEKVKPIVQDGIELYVSSDQKESGMSVRGLARFCGVSSTALSEKLLAKLNDPTTLDLPEVLKPFAGMAFTRTLVGDNKGGEANIIPSKTCEGIIFYYAFESKRVSDETRAQALGAYRKFAQFGLHSWILKAVGHIERNDSNELLSLVQQVLTEVKELRTVSTEYKAIREKTTTFMPGADDLLNSLSEVPDTTKALTDGSMSLEGWLSTKGITLEKAQFRRLAQIVCDTYRSLVKEDPPKAKFVTNGIAKYNVSVFKPEHFPILQIGLNKLLA